MPKNKRKTIYAADLFCGAGGASTGLVRACRDLGLELDLLAINHWPVAVETHQTNHPGVRHLCESVENVDPLKEVPSGRLNLLLAGPECTHFSTAAGGRPMNDQSRATAWHILKWAQELYIETILIENIPAFKTWGPLGANRRPLKSKKGETYRAFLNALRSLGYIVEDVILNAADYGDPTTRQRLFIQARRGRRHITWPVPTHSKTGASTLFGERRRWVPARQVIDWSINGKSIFNRKKSLRPATLARIFAGLKKFGGPELQPFLVAMEHGGRLLDIDNPLPTITTAKGGAFAIAQPFLVQFKGTSDEQIPHTARDIDQPVGTLTGSGADFGVVQPFVLPQHGGGNLRPVDQPLPTIATGGAIAVVEPFLVPMYSEREGQEPRTHSVADPVPTIPATGNGKFGVVEPYLTKYYGSGEGVSPASEPVPTVTTRDRFALVEPFIVPPRYSGTDERVNSIDEPLKTITGASGRCFGLVQPVIDGYVLDIHFRMLQPHELAAAMSFPKEYVFTGTREDVVKQIGNSWAGELSKALCKTMLSSNVKPKRSKTEKAA